MDHSLTELSRSDPVLADILRREGQRQAAQIELIASENIVSKGVREALGSSITNKTVEGYPGRRFHGGAQVVDEAERLAIVRAQQLFDCKYANVQPHSGSQANQAVFVALLKPGDTVLSMALAAGGHLSHGAAPHMSGKWFNVVSYGVDRTSGLLDYDQVERLAIGHRPVLLIAGGSAYPRVIDFARLRAAADRVGATFLVDMAHFAGLVAGGEHPSPIPHAHIVSGTTTKTLRGPRGGFMLTGDDTLARRLDAAVFPGAQGSIHLNNVAAKAVCFGEALQPSFKQYAGQVISNARTLAQALSERGFSILTGGTDTHLLLVDVSTAGITGDQAEKAIEHADLTCNKNALPGDTGGPGSWTGVRLGVSAVTTRGMRETEMAVIGHCLADVWENTDAHGNLDPAVVQSVRHQVAAICRQFPVN